MATDFTNKYMQVFQTYDEFGEHSADYVKGEDHIAYLIQENEVIYWLYLEQVWRPLNVRTTTTGELEDGRTKVAVRLEYIEGGQKYTSVPNIPDPERITSMSRFLEDYPDIEEVNVSGTVNLTDLSYAFAGSKIKDFSMLDTSNVTNFIGFLDDVNEPTIDYILNINNTEKNNHNQLKGLICNKFTLNVIDYYNDRGISFRSCDINELNINNSDCSIQGDWTDREFEIKNINCFNASIGNNNYRLLKTDNINIVDTLNLYPYFLLTDKEVNVNANLCNIYLYSADLDNKLNISNTSVFLNGYNNNTCGYKFGYGINFANCTIAIKSADKIGNFVFTTPIVDDTFYAKYAQYNTPISIFQYKTTFEEVADVNISSEVDSNLLYVDWNIIINNYFNNINIEIYNKINAYLLDDVYSLYKDYIPRKIIIDNRNVNLIDIDDYPEIEYSYRGTIHSQTETLIDNYRISGKYKVIQDNNYCICNSFMFKDIDIYSKNDIVTVYSPSTNLYNFDNNRNIKIHSKIHLILIQSNNVNFDISSLIINNSIYISCNILNGINCLLKIKYIENVELNIFGGILSVFRYWLENSTITNYINIKGNVFLCENNSLSSTIFGLADNVYIKCDDDCWINYLDGHVSTRNITFISIAKNINGIINIILTDYVSSLSYTTNNIEHIDIYNVKCTSTSTQILSYLSLDNETTINLITKLIDNTDSSSKTIYMYRSQANIIGEENIAGAVAKNYEFAIIEN